MNFALYIFISARILVTTGFYDQSNKRQLNKVTEIIDLFDHESSFGFVATDLMRVAATGGLLDGQIVICGGAKYTRMGKYGMFHDMYSVHNSKVITEDMINQRAYAASVILNLNKFTTNLWVTGGQDRQENGVKSSEFVLIRDGLELDDDNQPSEVRHLDSIEGNIKFCLEGTRCCH